MQQSPGLAQDHSEACHWTGLEPPNCLCHLQAYLSLAGAGDRTWPTSAPEVLLGPSLTAVPASSQEPATHCMVYSKTVGTDRRAGLEGDLTAGGKMQRLLFCVLYQFEKQNFELVAETVTQGNDFVLVQNGF